MFFDINGFFICSIQNKFVPLHRESTPGICKYFRGGFADILKRRLLRFVLKISKLRNFQNVHSGQSNDRCPTGYRLSLLCLFWYVFCVYTYAHTRTLTKNSTENVYIRRGLRVVSSNVQGNAKTSKSWNDSSRNPRFFCILC